ncbi:MAG: hypothetical protein FWB85_05805 [Chitinispirillia bacterium]|nr:hypothetical protein [Chitinispirillia bacterium]
MKTAATPIAGRRAPIALFLCLAIAAAAPAAEYRVSLDGVLDNREYGGIMPGESGTFFFTRTEAEAGLAVEGCHKIRAGLLYMQEFGAPASFENARILPFTPASADNPQALLYYHYDDSSLQFRFGSFPRAAALSLPEWLFGGEISYYRPFIHGAAVEANQWGVTASAWADWTGRQDVGIRESFLFGYGIGYKRGPLFARHDFMMYHLAPSLSVFYPPEDIPRDYVYYSGVYDYGGLSAEAGAAFGATSKFDSLSVSAGAVASLVRDRAGDGIWYTPTGGFISGFAASGFLAVRGLAYFGEAQTQFWGSEFWRTGWLISPDAGAYARLDLIARLTIKENVRAELFQSFHTVGENYPNRWPIGYSQHFILHAEFKGPKKEPEKEEKKKKGFSINVKWD